ncbi:hypothetical protein VOLCADRAFT_86703 [Volvox carteri f. nagariensis]|uniref:Rubisco LSMT substrate-binding domain-containing protein n=1 Tax=Volvox carteri f. nagariensis TaxID=3068 RepID=D8TJD6_VOLCA|nr:uncharacterized protein VOLCADRAFT_86703 [Volvox carteri f. nagariensis]EFJ52354.1 hypothetical protein VOLCADRAFT_86703 [Volvox carteri f. nagariensis]|eukprot:XP_002946427.1 hypothetical protein VOLCADRAFT_86703 [Volvox carteri f. nagariensis]
MADQELTSWCMLNGVTFNGIVAAFVSEGWRGIVATRDLQPGEAVLRVPERLLLTTRSAARDPQLAAALQRHTERSRGVAAAPSCGGGCGLGPHQVLACHLLLEVSRGPQSFWWPYLKQLPRSYTSLANFSPDDVAELQLQDALDAAEAAVERARTEWRQALHVLHDLPAPCTYPGAPPAASRRTVTSTTTNRLGRRTHRGLADRLPRALACLQPPQPHLMPVLLPSTPQWLPRCLAPQALSADSAAVGKGNDNAKSGVYDGDGGDVNGGGSGGYDDGGGSDVGGSGGGTLANTGGRDEEDCEYTIAGDGMWDEATQQYCIVVRRPYREGEQVMLCYGRYTNLELLEYYGFVLEGNLHDTARLDPALLPLPSAARTAGGAPHLAPSDCFLHANGQPSWQLLHLLRYCAASPVERRSAGHLMAAGERVSEQGDRLALKWLHAACGSQLAALPTTVVQDLELLRQLNGTQEPEVRQRQQQQQQQNEVVPRPQHEAVCEAVAAAVSPVALGAGMSPRKEVAQATEEGPGAAEPPGAARDVAVAGATKAAAVPNCTPQSHAPPSQPAAVPTEAAAASGGVSARALSDGLTCARLALQWRIQQKQILLRALRYAEDVLGPDAHAAAARGRPPVLAGGLSALIQRQRKVLAPTRPSYNQDDLSPA